MKAARIHPVMIAVVLLFIFGKAHSQSSEVQSLWKQNRDEIIRILSQFSEDNSISNLVHDDNKCGFWISMQLAEQWNIFSPEQKVRLRELHGLQLSQTDTVIGSFRIFYDTTGINEPALLDENMERMPNTARAYVDSVGRYLNYVWDFIIDTLGYESPPFRNGSSEYPITIEELGSTVYGETVFDIDFDRIGNYIPPRFTSFTRIDNDYFGFFQSPGIEGLKVTLAHELHHAVQIGSYGVRNSDMYFYEITSTWMEDVIFDDVNDYYQYLSNNPIRLSHFAHPDVGFVRANGSIEYSRAIWGKYIEKRFDRDVMLSAWYYLREEIALSAIDHSLRDRGSSFRSAFTEWAAWNLNAGPDADTIKYYTEGMNYPAIARRPMIVYLQTPRSFDDTIDVVSCSYRSVCVVQNPMDSCNQDVRMIITVMNLNTSNAYSLLPLTFGYNMTPDADDTYKRLSNGIWVKLIVPDPENWVTQETIPSIFSDIYVYPNPYSGGGFINFRLPPVKSNIATLTVYTVSFDRIQSSELSVESLSFEPVIRWDTRDGNGNFISSGIYIYVISVDDMRYTGKFAVLRD